MHDMRVHEQCGAGCGSHARDQSCRPRGVAPRGHAREPARARVRVGLAGRPGSASAEGARAPGEARGTNPCARIVYEIGLTYRRGVAAGPEGLLPSESVRDRSRRRAGQGRTTYPLPSQASQAWTSGEQQCRRAVCRKNERVQRDVQDAAARVRGAKSGSMKVSRCRQECESALSA